LGKTLLTPDFCARVTTGKPFPGGGPAIGPVNVLLLNAEDALEDTLKPRLQGMGADLERVFGIDEEEYGLSEPPRFPADQAALGQALARTQARLVIIDPVVAFLERTIQSGNDQCGNETWCSAFSPLARRMRRRQRGRKTIRTSRERVSSQWLVVSRGRAHKCDRSRFRAG
jgi:hypothetical protein